MNIQKQNPIKQVRYSIKKLNVFNLHNVMIEPSFLYKHIRKRNIDSPIAIQMMACIFAAFVQKGVIDEQIAKQLSTMALKKSTIYTSPPSQRNVSDRFKDVIHSMFDILDISMRSSKIIFSAPLRVGTFVQKVLIENNRLAVLLFLTAGLCNMYYAHTQKLVNYTNAINSLASMQKSRQFIFLRGIKSTTNYIKSLNDGYYIEPLDIICSFEKLLLPMIKQCNMQRNHAQDEANMLLNTYYAYINFGLMCLSTSLVLYGSMLSNPVKRPKQIEIAQTNQETNETTENNLEMFEN